MYAFTEHDFDINFQMYFDGTVQSRLRLDRS